MTIQEAIENTDELKPNAYPTDVKVRWLSELDGIVWREVIAAHEGQPEEEYAPYAVGADMGTELLIPWPYAFSCYTYYLQAMIDQQNSETVKYNQDMTMFNEAYARFCAWYTRTHRPLQRVKTFRV